MNRPSPAPGFRTVGQEVARGTINRAMLGSRIGRTLLIHGPAGAGKGAFLDDMLALVFCVDPDVQSRPCNACHGCRDARARSHPDLVHGSPERWRAERFAGESIVAAARRWLLTAAGSPLVADRRIVVVEQADSANEQIQNAMLKALEEPAERQLFILVADDAQRLLPTIRSRCQALRIGPVPRAQLSEWLVDHERLPADQADSLARLSGGLPGRAIAMARNPELIRWRTRVQSELLSLLDRGRADRFGSARELLAEATRRGAGTPSSASDEPDGRERTAPGAAPQRAGALAIVGAWSELARDLAVAAAGRSELSVAGELHTDLAAAGRRIGRERAAAFVRRLEQVRAALQENAAPVLALDAAMLDWPTAALPAR